LLVRTILACEGYTVYEARDGLEAWQALHQHRPAVALLDVQMPGRSGIELASAIREDAALANTCVVLLTARTQQADVAAGLAAGADLYLTKPFSPLELPATLERALATRRAGSGSASAA
jgi:DNA-binding response OmpR family regulator